MPAYVIANVKEVTDPAGFEKYQGMAETSIANFGGRYVVRGGAVEKAEGDWTPNRLVVLEFPTMERAKEWYNSAEYTTAKELRWKTAHTDAVFVEGV